ncbi:hypothetical protein ABTE27_22505, partial [Acinetobacter baumannii]
GHAEQHVRARARTRRAGVCDQVGDHPEGAPPDRRTHPLRAGTLAQREESAVLLAHRDVVCVRHLARAVRRGARS